MFWAVKRPSLEDTYMKTVSPENSVTGMETTVPLLTSSFIGLMALSFSDQGCCSVPRSLFPIIFFLTINFHAFFKT